MDQVVLILLLLGLASAADPCVFTDSTTGFVYNLNDLQSNSDYFVNQEETSGEFETASFWLNMCESVHASNCGSGQAGCAQLPQSFMSFFNVSVGSTKSMKLQMSYQFNGTYGLMAYFTGGVHKGESYSMQYDFYCDKVNRGPSVPIESPPGHFNFKWLTPAACPVDPCEQIYDCSGCASSNCVWCVDSLACHSKANISHCEYTISNPDLCPQTSCQEAIECQTCTAASMQNKCEWCLDNNICVDSSDTKCWNYIKSPGYCPRKFNFN